MKQLLNLLAQHRFYAAVCILLDGHLLLHPRLFAAVLAACLVFNVLSTLLPACLAVRRSISYTLVGGE